MFKDMQRGEVGTHIWYMSMKGGRPGLWNCRLFGEDRDMTDTPNSPRSMKIERAVTQR